MVWSSYVVYAHVQMIQMIIPHLPYRVTKHVWNVHIIPAKRSTEYPNHIGWMDPNGYLGSFRRGTPQLHTSEVHRASGWQPPHSAPSALAWCGAWSNHDWASLCRLHSLTLLMWWRNYQSSLYFPISESSRVCTFIIARYTPYTPYIAGYLDRICKDVTSTNVINTSKDQIIHVLYHKRETRDPVPGLKKTCMFYFLLLMVLSNNSLPLNLSPKKKIL